MSEQTKLKYHGNCHCKAIEFEFESVAIVAGLKCNCSICRRKNAVMSLDYIAASDFKWLKGESELSKYLWNDKDVNHYFCSKCGNYPFHDTIYKLGDFRINYCCVDQIDTEQLQIKHFDGKNEL